MGGQKALSVLHPAPGSAESVAPCEDSGFSKAHPWVPGAQGTLWESESVLGVLAQMIRN